MSNQGTLSGGRWARQILIVGGIPTSPFLIEETIEGNVHMRKGVDLNPKEKQEIRDLFVSSGGLSLEQVFFTTNTVRLMLARQSTLFEQNEQEALPHITGESIVRQTCTFWGYSLEDLFKMYISFESLDDAQKRRFLVTVSRWLLGHTKSKGHYATKRIPVIKDSIFAISYINPHEKTQAQDAHRSVKFFESLGFNVKFNYYIAKQIKKPIYDVGFVSFKVSKKVSFEKFKEYFI